MKNTFIRPTLLVLGLSLGLAGCKDALEIAPQQGIDASGALNTPEKVGGAVVGMYAKLDNPRLYGTDLIMVPELIGPEGYVQWLGTFTSYRQIALRTLNSLNTTAAGIWQRAYEDINQANLVLSALPVVSDVALRNQYEGEARFVRGALYFELVRLYGQQYQPGGPNAQLGVPISLSANLTVEQASVKLPRATVAQVYAQVISDLTAAIAKLPESNGTRANTYSAQAFLARVYLQQSNYAAARTAADGVISNSGKTLAGSVGAVFANRNGNETLFELQQNDQNNAGTSNDGLATYFAGYSLDGGISGIGRGDLRVLGTFSSQYGDSDARGTDSLEAGKTRKLIYLGNYARPGRLRSLKYRTYGQNIPIIRLAEMYLIRAEADVRAGNTLNALNDVNRIRARSGATALITVTLNNVLKERQLELAFEGFHIYDLKRTNAVIIPATSTAPAVNANDPKLILPIPQHDINLNELLVQNATY